MSIKQGNNYIATGGSLNVDFSDITGQPSDNTNLETALNAKANDSDVVKLTGNQTISGTKIFNVDYTGFKGTAIDITNAKTTQNSVGINWIDKNGTVLGQNHVRTYTTGDVQNNMHIKAHNSNTWACISIGFDSNDNVFTYAPTPATADNSTKIATTAYFRNNMQVVSALPASPTAGVFYFVKE